MRSSAIDHHQRGSAMIPILLAAALLGIVSYVVPDVLRGTKRFVSNTRDVVELKLLASDLMEVGKYLVLNEKVFFLEDTFDKNPQRVQTLKNLWGQSMGDQDFSGNNLNEACGGYDTKLKYLGTGKLTSGGASAEQQKVFCPSFVRTPFLSSLMLQDIFFRKWALMEQAVLDPGNFFKVSLDMTETFRERRDTIFELGYERGILNKKDHVLRMGVDLTFHLDGTGFSDEGSRRFVTIEGWVEMEAERQTSRLTEVDSFSFEIPTIKEFAIFNIWPTDSKLDARTNLWSESMQISSNAEIYGKVYFNGDIDVPLADLPTFYQTVVISGSYTGPFNYSAKDIDLMRRKFKKGLVTNFSAARFVLDGVCSDVTPGVEVINGSQLNCRQPATGQPMTMEAYLDNNLEWGPLGQHNIRLTQRGIENCSCARKFDHPACNDSGNALSICDQNIGAQAWVFEGGASMIRIPGAGGRPIALATPAMGIHITRGQVYGSMMTGYLKVDEGAQIYSVSALAPGLPGIVDKNYLDTQLNPAFARAYKGIAVPVTGFPMVTQSKDGFK